MDKREREKSEDGKRDQENEGQREMLRWRGKENTRGGRSPSEGSAGPGGRGDAGRGGRKKGQGTTGRGRTPELRSFFLVAEPENPFMPTQD